MIFVMVFLSVLPVASFSLHLKVHGDPLEPGKYNISGSIDVSPDGNMNLRLKAKKTAAVHSLQLPGHTPTPSTIVQATIERPFTNVTPSNAELIKIPANENSGSLERQIGLDRHNQYRRIHNAPDIQLSEEINNDAQRYADKLARESLFAHDQNNNAQGENIGVECASDKGSDADVIKKFVDSWYNEVCDYHFDRPGFSGSTGHFTQVVWKESTQLGIGFARGSYSFDGKERFNNCLFVVCRYKESGNKMNAFEQNVSKGRFNKQVFCPPPGSKKKSQLSSKTNTDKIYRIGSVHVKRMHVF